MNPKKHQQNGLSQWMHRENLDLTYARWKNGRREGEVDLVLVDDRNFKPVWAVEIKWSNRYFEKKKKLNSLLEFCKTHSFNSALVTSIDNAEVKKVDDIQLSFLPASVYSYNIGDITLKMKISS